MCRRDPTLVSIHDGPGLAAGTVVAPSGRVGAVQVHLGLLLLLLLVERSPPPQLLGGAPSCRRRWRCR